MKRAMILFATLTLAGTMAAQTTPIPPAPPTQATPAPPATQATPAPKPRTRVQVYRAMPAASSSSGSYLGVDVRDVSSDRVQALKLKNDQGVEITMVDQDGPAGKSGLKEHDVVVSYNGQNVQSAEQLRRMIRETKPAQNVALGIMRDGQPTTINVTLGDRAKLYPSTAPKVWRMETPNMVVRIPDIEIPSFVMTTSSRRNGVTVENLTTQLGDYFGVKNGEGILVRSVEKGSKAEAAGLKAGDVIIRVDNERVSDTREWSRLLRNHEAGTVKLGIMRDRREQTLSLTLPEAKSEESFVIPGQDFEQTQVEWERFGPQFVKERADVQARIAREMASHQKEIQRAMRDAQREVERSLRDLQREHEREKRERDKEKDKDEE
jgi:membrane-associated protease RseP (regulator of RpoE activity)